MLVGVNIYAGAVLARAAASELEPGSTPFNEWMQYMGRGFSAWVMDAD